MESHAHLWLLCPQPAWMLLMAKLAVAMLPMIAIIIITVGMLLLEYYTNPNPNSWPASALRPCFTFVLETGTYAAVFTIARQYLHWSLGTLISVANALAGNLLGRFRCWQASPFSLWRQLASATMQPDLVV